jgi:hypothetical protein
MNNILSRYLIFKDIIIVLKNDHIKIKWYNLQTDYQREKFIANKIA